MNFPLDLSLLPTRGPCSKYEVSIAEGEFRGKLELTFESEPMRVSYINTYRLQEKRACNMLPIKTQTETKNSK